MLHLFRPLLQTIIWTCFIAASMDVEMIVAQDSSNPDPVVATIEPGGIRRYERGKWSTLSLSAVNQGDEAAFGTLSVFLDRDTRMQYTRRYWVPAHAIRSLWLPIRTPDKVSEDQEILYASVLNVVGSGDAAILNRTKDENRLIGESLLALAPAGLNTGMITDRPLHGEADETSTGPDEVYETVVAVRKMHDGNRQMSNLHDRFMAPYPEAYEALEQLVISNDRIAADSGGIAAIRQWIARGGSVWIMLDLVDIETVRSLLGNATPYEVVDRVALTEFTIDASGMEQTETGSSNWVAEKPVDFLRVALDSCEVYSSIDGWPASFSVPFGNGKVFFTTLAARGWRSQIDEFSATTEAGQPTSEPTKALKIFSGNFNKHSATASELSDGIKPILLEQLGYHIPSRSVAALLLGLSWTVIAITGIWLARRKQLDLFAWVVPFGTIIPAFAFIAIGSAHTSSIPATSSVLRLANISGETNEIHANAMVAFYSPDTVELPLEVDVSGVVTPDLQDLTGVAKRAVWNDEGHGKWEQVTVSSGSVRFARAKESRVLAAPIRAHATFGTSGLEGRVVGVDQLGTPEDAVIASPAAPRSAAKIQPAGAFHVGPDDVLSGGEFVGEALLSTSQQQRQAVYRDVFRASKDSRYPQRTTLFVWGNANSLGLTIPALFQQSGATLFAIPVDLHRTAPGKPFMVPATFVRISNAAKRAGRSLLFNSTTGTWQADMRTKSESLFQFAMPREVLPCRINNAQIALKIHAPSRTIEITGIKDGAPVVIETRKNVSGVIRLNVDDPDLLLLNENGALQFGLNVSQTDSQIARAGELLGAFSSSSVGGDSLPSTRRLESIDISSWNIDYLRLQASGETE